MFRNYFLVNLLLLLIISVLGFRFYKIVSHSGSLPADANVKALQRTDARTGGREGVINDSVFDNISRLDLFRPSRSAPTHEDRKREDAPPKDPPRLFGTVILNDHKTAILEDPDTKVTKMYRVNDSVAGYTLLEILEDKVVLTRDGNKYEVRLRENKGISPVQRPAVRPAVTRAVPQTRARPVPRRMPARITPPAQSSSDVPASDTQGTEEAEDNELQQE